jgi:hemerythrin superfamily protein
MDAITMLRDDHKTVEKLFKEFEAAGDRAFVAKRRIVDRIIEELSIHAAIEEQFLYPVARASVPGAEDMTLESIEEHQIVKWVMSELEHLDPEQERFDAKVTVLIENVRHHVTEEEEDLFPDVRSELGRKELVELGERMAAARDLAPTHPHPLAPDAPPGDKVANGLAGIADRLGDTISGVAQGGVTAVGDLLATILGRQKPKVSPTGTTRTRAIAKDVRSTAADAAETVEKQVERVKGSARDAGESAIDAVRDTVDDAEQGVKDTAAAAESGAKGTATSARRSAKRVKSTAKGAATSTARTAKQSASKTASTASRGAERTAEKVAS